MNCRIGSSVLLLALWTQAPFAHASDLPDLTCQVTKHETILTKTWAYLGHAENTSLHKIRNNELFLSSSVRDEYLYGALKKVEHGRYQVGYKTIVFTTPSFTSATVSHHDNNSIAVAKLHCSKT